MDAARLYAGFDVSVMASLHEGFPNAVMEAMAAGVAVVATAVGGIPELIEDGHTGYLVAPADSDALAERIMFALGDEAGRSAIAARGCEFVMKRFSMAKMVKAVEKLYDELYTTRKSESNCLLELESPVRQAFQPDPALPRRTKASGSKA
jgi:glycosyltransferase involved in cell wall biosynthesis